MKKVFSMLLSLVMIISVFSLTQLNAFASQSTTVKFEQSEARTVLNMINSFRASSDAWYWNSDKPKFCCLAQMYMPKLCQIDRLPHKHLQELSISTV